MGSGSFIKVVLKNLDVLAGPIVTLVYPLYASVKAIETKSPIDDQQWLTYWVLYSLMTLFELTFAKVIEWLPFWPFAKLIFSCWLVLPYFSGAAYVYQHFVRPMFVNQQTVNIWYVPRKKGIFSKPSIFSKPDDVLVAAEKFIEENGPEAFQKLINKAEKDTKPKKSGRRVTFKDAVAKKTAPKTVKNSNPVINTKSGTIFDEPEVASVTNTSKHSIFDEPEVASAINTSKRTIFNEPESARVIDTSNHPIFDEPAGSRESTSWTNSSYMIFGNEDYRY